MGVLKEKTSFESMSIGVLLSMVGGLLDAHTFLFRGGVFANTQTGNIVLFGVNIANKNFYGAIYYVFPILAFIVGVILTEILKSKTTYKTFVKWEHTILFLEIIILFSLGFINGGKYNTIVNISISFVCSLQVNSFKKLKGHDYATTMCTGNLRLASANLFHFISSKDKNRGVIFLRYFIVIISFCLGAVLGGVFTNVFKEKTLWICCILLIMTFCLTILKDRSENKKEI